MAASSKPHVLHLTERHVALVKRDITDPGPQLVEGFRSATDADYAQVVDQLRASAPEGGFWLFAYGSLIWNPEIGFTEKRLATARSWHRAFCLGWDYRFRGNKEQPGLMLALDRGGQCQGVVYRLAPETLETELHKLIRREMSMVPSAFPPRWIKVQTPDGPLTALTFAINRKSGRYVGGMAPEALADILARASGFRGSMPEYLFSTVSHLEALGIHDRHLWHMQRLVAERIEAMHSEQ